MKSVPALSALTLAGICMFSTGTSASITVFTDRSAFEAATGATTVEDFTSGPHFPITSGILNSSTNEVVAVGTPIVPGTILPGVTYSTPVGTGNFFNIDLGGRFDGGFLDTVTGPRVLTITFDAAQNGFGFDTNELMGAFTVVINGADVENFSAVSSSTPTFFGFESSSRNILTATIAGDSRFVGFAIDNFTYSIPEPSTWAMMLIGFAGLGHLGYRRARGRAVLPS
jgi:hypothetical protein